MATALSPRQSPALLMLFVMIKALKTSWYVIKDSSYPKVDDSVVLVDWLFQQKVMIFCTESHLLPKSEFRVKFCVSLCILLVDSNSFHSRGVQFHSTQLGKMIFITPSFSYRFTLKHFQWQTAPAGNWSNCAPLFQSDAAVVGDVP